MATKAQLMSEAAHLEAHAKDSLHTWTILGQTEKYGQYMEKARKLRRAAEMRVVDRNQYMRDNGLPA